MGAIMVTADAVASGVVDSETKKNNMATTMKNVRMKCDFKFRLGKIPVPNFRIPNGIIMIAAAR